MANPWEKYADQGSASGPWNNYSEPQAKPRPEWKDLPGNVPESAANLIKGLYGAVTSPLQTAGSILDIGAGALRNSLPSGLVNAVETIPGTGKDAGERASATASNVGQFYKDRYGGLESTRNALITDPVGVVGDVSTILSGGAGLASKLGQLPKLGAVGQVAPILSSAAKYTNPLSIVPPAAKLAGKATVTVLGLPFATGVGGRAIEEAAKAGRQLNPAFWNNLTGKADISGVIDDFKLGLDKAKQEGLSKYKASMTAAKSYDKPLQFGEIDAAMNGFMDSIQVKGQGGSVRYKIGNDELSKIQEVKAVVDDWKQAPDLHTVDGLDALKQRIQAIYPDSPKQSQAQRASTVMANAVKDTIKKQAPDYAEAMKSYSDMADLVSEVERTFSMGQKSLPDTTMRKLQSLMRNNVNTNYGNRLQLADKVDSPNLMPALAGQSMSSWGSRGLTGQLGQGAAGIGGFTNPQLLALLPIMSPKVVGASAYGLGAASNAIPRVSPMQALAASQGGLLAQRNGNNQ